MASVWCFAHGCFKGVYVSDMQRDRTTLLQSLFYFVVFIFSFGGYPILLVVVGSRISLMKSFSIKRKNLWDSAEWRLNAIWAKPCLILLCTIHGLDFNLESFIYNIWSVLFPSGAVLLFSQGPHYMIFDCRMFWRCITIGLPTFFLPGNDGTYVLHVGSIKKGSWVLHGKCF